MTQNQISYWNLVETERANRAREEENTRANQAKEQISRDTNAINLQLGMANNAEAIRSNLAKELENNRTNMANEDIKRVQNAINALDKAIKMQEVDVKRGELSLGYANLGELIRSHQANEGLNLASILETNRANLAREEETNRSNVSNENIKRFSAALQGGAAMTGNSIDSERQKEGVRHDLAVEGETKRNNITNSVMDALNILAGIKKNNDTNATNFLREFVPSLSIRR